MALIVKADGSREELKGAGEGGRVTYEQIRAAIGGGYVEHVDTKPEKAEGHSHIYMDEEGKYKDFPINVEATTMSAFTQPGDFLVGDVVFCTDAEDMQ